MLWNAENGSVPIGDTEMYYASFGRGEKAVVLLPGLSDGLVTVKGKALLLASTYKPFFDQYTVYMFSRKNQMPRGYSIRDMASDQVAALKALGIERTSLWGVSQGGMIVQYMAIDYPELVEKLVITVSTPCPSEMTRECVSDWIRLAQQGDHKKLMIASVERIYSGDRLKSYRKLYPIIGLIRKPENYDRFIINAEAILGFDVSDEVGRIQCPTLIIAGDEDQIVGVEASYELHEKIPGSQLQVYPGLGHGVYEEAPDYNLRVLRFLESDC